MWINQTEVKSESSGRIYIVSELVVDGMPTGTWGCSCPGWKSRGNCKHLRSMGLRSAREESTPAPRGHGHSDNGAFSDAAYAHYDPTVSGFGNSAQWRELAEAMRGGKVKVITSDEQWAEIFRLVDQRELDESQMAYLMEWTEGEWTKPAGEIIRWLQGLPERVST